MAEAFKDADVVYPKAGHLLRQWKSELNYMAMVTGGIDQLEQNYFLKIKAQKIGNVQKN